MEIQTILTVIIVAAAVAVTICHLWRSFNPKRDTHTTHCSSGCDGCSLKNKCTYNN